MGIENIGSFDYSTAEKIDGTLQDKIDELKLSTQKSLQELSKEVFSSLTTLTVDTLNTRLNVRDIDGVIIGKLEDKEKVTYLNDHIEKEGKIFVKIKQENGESGYVSADYVKADGFDYNNCDDQLENDDDQLENDDDQLENDDDQLENGDDQLENGDDQLENGDDQLENGDDQLENDDDQLENGDDQLENGDDIELTYNQHLINRDGRIFLVGPDGTEVEYTNELSEADEILLENFETASILNEILSIWKNQAVKVSNSLHWKDSRDDDEIILGEVSKIEEKFSAVYIKAITGKNISQEINEIFNMIQVAEDQEDIIGSSDMEKVKQLLLSNKSKDEKILSIFNAMRYGGWSGDSSNVKEKVSQKLLNTPEFKDINDIITNEETLNYIKNHNKDALIGLLGEDLAEKILDSYATIKSKQEKSREIYAQHLESINNQRKENGEEEYSLNDYIELNVDFSVMNLLKHALIRAKIDKMPVRGGETESYTGLYADISGLAERRASMNDIFDIGDDNIDAAIDVSATLALSLVSMGVGMIAARGAMWAARGITNATKASNLTNKAGKIGGLTRFAGASTIEGSAFYGGTTLTNSLIYGNDWDEYSSNPDDWNKKELLKSIAFMGVLRGASKVMKELQLAKGLEGNVSIGNKFLGGLGKMTDKVPPLMMKGVSITGVLAEAGLITATSVGLEVAFEGEGHFTWEEYLQAVVMVGLFRGSAKLFISKNSKGEVQVKEIKTEGKQNRTESRVEQSTSEVTYVHKGTGKEYTYIGEGKNGKIKVRNENGNIVHVNKNNLELKSEKFAKEVISKEEYLNYRHNGRVSDSRLDDIMRKSLNKEKLSERETQILMDPKLSAQKEAAILRITREATPEMPNKEIDISKLLDKELSTLKNNGKAITHGEYQTQLKNGEYTITGPNGYKKDFLTRKDAVEALNSKLGNNQAKIDLLFASAQRESLAKLNSLSKNKEFELDGKTVRIKKEGESFILQEKNGNNGMRDLEVKNLSPKQQELLLEKIIGSKGVNVFKSLINKITPEKVLTKSEKENIISKYGKDKYEGFIKEAKDASTSTFSFIMWLLRGKKGGVFSKTTMVGGVLANESIEAMTNTQDYMDEFGTWTHAGNIISNAILMKQFGIIRGLIYSEVIDDGADVLIEVSDELIEKYL